MRTVSLIGRPNTGKSTLFNALLGYRRSIVFNEPGTTIDRVIEKVTWGQLNLMDLQGIFTASDESVVDKALELGDRVLFVVDGLAGVTPFDTWIANLILASRKPTLLVINKCDRQSVFPEDFASLGFENVALVSAEHRRGLDLVKQFCLDDLTEETQAQSVTNFQLALLGRPNTGKSTLMNRLCSDEVSRVSPIAHTTRDPVSFEFKDADATIKIIDTAGVRRPRSEKESIEVFSIQASTRTVDQSDVVFLLIDGKEGICDQDIRLLNLIHRSGKPAAVLLNFWDTLGRQERDKFLKEGDFYHLVKDLKIIPISALTGFNMARLIPVAKSLYRRANQRIPTSKLNRIVRALVQKNPPPSGGKGNFNILYASQTKVAPPTFVFFMNRKAQFPKSYSRYLENQLRDKLALQSQAIRVLFREC